MGKLRQSVEGPSTKQLSGRVMLSDDTLSLAAQLTVGDIAVINHPDLDRASALALVEAKPMLVLNSAPSVTGRYPNRGPEVLLQAGIPLVDNLGTAILGLKSGQKVSVNAGQVFLAGRLIAEGSVVTYQTYTEAAQDAQFGMADRLESFAANTKEFLQREQDFLFTGQGLEDVELDCRNQIVVVVGSGVEAKNELASLRTLIREHRPILIGVGSGADLIVGAGYKPNLVTGNLKAASDVVVRSGAEIVLHSMYQDEMKDSRLDSIGLKYSTVTSNFTDYDVALLIALYRGAKLVIPVGDFASFDEFLDQGRQGMTSAFFAHLMGKGKIAPAKTAALLFARPLRLSYVVLMLLCALVMFVSALLLTPLGKSFWVYGGSWSWPLALSGLALSLVLVSAAAVTSSWRNKK